MKIQMDLKMERGRKENRTGRRIRRAAKDTLETKRGPKRNFGLLDGVVCH